MDLRTTGMEFASEMVVKATLLKMNITEVPTTLSPDGRSHPPHLKPWRDGWRHLRFMLLYSPTGSFLPGTRANGIGPGSGCVAAAGSPAGGKRRVGRPLAAVCGVAVVVGFQAVLFSMLSKIFAMNEGLLPHSPALEKAFKYITLEVGLAVGSAVLIAGLAGAVVALASGAGRFRPPGRHPRAANRDPFGDGANPWMPTHLGKLLLERARPTHSKAGRRVRKFDRAAESTSVCRC